MPQNGIVLMGCTLQCFGGTTGTRGLFLKALIYLCLLLNSFFITSNLAETVSHETEIDRQRDQRHRERNQAYDRHRGWDHRRERSPSHGHHDCRDREDAPRTRDDARVTKLAQGVSVPKVLQSKVELVLEQLDLLPFTSNLEIVWPPKKLAYQSLTSMTRRPETLSLTWFTISKWCPCTLPMMH